MEPSAKSARSELLTVSTLSDQQLRRVLKVSAELNSDSAERHFFDNTARHFRAPALEAPLLAFVDSPHSDGDRRPILSQLASYLPSSAPSLGSRPTTTKPSCSSKSSSPILPTRIYSKPPTRSTPMEIAVASSPPSLASRASILLASRWPSIQPPFCPPRVTKPPCSSSPPPT